MITAILGMVSAKDCQEFRQALRQWGVPVQNVVSADADGNIAHSYPGRIPIRAAGDGRLPVPGWTGEYEWTGYIPFEDLPHQFNPPAGYIATANNRTVDAGYPYDLGNDFVGPGRAQRIHELIQSVEKVDVAFIQRMHLDQVSCAARAVAKFLSGLSTDDPELQIVLRHMGAWDGHLAVDSPEASVYEAFVQCLARRLLEPRLGELTEHYMGKGITPFLQESSILSERCREWVMHILDQPDSHWWNLGQGESYEQQALLALRAAVDLLKSKLGPGYQDWAWGRLHTLTLSHTLGAKKPLDRLFNKGPFPVGGNGDTIWCTLATTYSLDSGPMVGPPFRFIADLADLSRSLGQLLPGQSGQPTSPHYADNIQSWLRGEYHPMLYHRQEVLAHAEATLNLLPPLPDA
jgi:penicillin amidase